MDRLCDLLEIFEDDAKYYDFISPYEVKVICKDNSEAFLYFHLESKRWEFSSSNMNYAAGYHD